MEKMRKGEILVGIGSTEKMGTGVNVQDHLSDLHHLDVPYLPSSVEQRDGRGWRQGNKNSQVNIHRYVSEGSLDQTFWQIIGNKTKFIKQVVTPGSTVSRVAKEEDTEELSPEQLMAAASGDPRILEKVNLDEDVKQLKAGLDRHNRNLVKLKQTISKAEQNVPELDSIAKRYEEAANHLDKNQDFSLEFDGKHYDNRKDASEAIDKALQDHDKYWGGYNNKPIGKYRGLEIRKIGSDVYLNTPGSPGNGIKTGDSLGSIEYVARNMRKSHEQSKADATKYREDIEKMKLGLDKKYHKEDELKSKSTRLTDLNAELQKERNGKLEEKPEEVPAEYKKPWEMNSDEFKTHLAEKVKGSSPVDKITEVRTATIKLHGDNIRAKIYKVPGLEGLSLAVKESKSPYHKNMKYHTIVEPESGAVLGRDLLMSSDAALENVKNKINGMISKYGSKEKAIQAIMVFGAHKNDMKIPESVAKEFPDLIN
jgi:transposase-like protein